MLRRYSLVGDVGRPCWLEGWDERWLGMVHQHRSLLAVHLNDKAEAGAKGFC